MFRRLDLDRSSAKEEYPNEIHLGFRKIMNVDPSEEIEGEVTLGHLLNDGFDDLMGFKQYPNDRSGKMTENPRRVICLKVISVRSVGKWGWF